MRKSAYRTAIYGSLLIASGVLLGACGDKKDPKMEEAGKVHLEAMAIEESLHEQIEAIDSIKIVLNDKKKTLTDAAQIVKADSVLAALDGVAKSFETWEENVIEVPGLAHEHHHGEGEHHHHDHKPAPDLTADQMLDVQKESKANIEKIKSDLLKVEEMLKQVL